MVDLLGLEVRGRSIGGVETCIEVPSARLAFDIGRMPASATSATTVLFTHAHIDHMGGVVAHAATRALRHMAPPTYVVPRSEVTQFQALFDVWRRLDRSDLPHELVPIDVGEEHVLPNGWTVRPFAAPHRAPCLGYGLWQRHKRLKPALQGRSQGEIRALHRAGEEVDDVTEVCELAFTGDCTAQLIDREEVVRNARRLIIEATFLDQRVPVAKARATGHTHLHEIAERAQLFENEALLLTHFSARYRRAEIIELVARSLPSELHARVQLLLDGWD
jgi:ribonuclease Z